MIVYGVIGDSKPDHDGPHGELTVTFTLRVQNRPGMPLEDIQVWSTQEGYDAYRDHFAHSLEPLELGTVDEDEE